jgi:hypothetical protein
MHNAQKTSDWTNSSRAIRDLKVDISRHGSQIVSMMDLQVEIL